MSVGGSDYHLNSAILNLFIVGFECFLCNNQLN